MIIHEPLTANGRTYYAAYDLERQYCTIYRDCWYLEKIPAMTRAECKRFPKLAGLAANARLKELLAQGQTVVMPSMSQERKQSKAGRPKGVNTALVHLSLPFHMVEWLNKQGNKSKTVQRLIQREMDKTSE